MKKHHKITASERDQIAWWLASEITIREMARRLDRIPGKVLKHQTPLGFTAYMNQSQNFALSYRPDLGTSFK
jgi:IS30 family transposase